MEKGNNLKYIAIFIIGLALGGVGSLAFFSKILFKEVEKNDKKETESQIETISCEEQNEIEELIDKLSYIDELGRNIKNIDDLTEDELVELAIKNIELKDDMYQGKEIREFIKNSTGREIDLKGSKIYDHLCDTAFMIFDENKDAFIFNEEHGGHGGIGLEIINRITDIKKENDIYTVTVYKMFSEYTQFFYERYYKSIEDVKSETNEIYTLKITPDLEGETSIPQVEDMNKVINSMDLNKLTKYTYELKKENNNFVLVSYNIG